MTPRHLLLCSALALSTLAACSRTPTSNDATAPGQAAQLDPIDQLDHAALVALALQQAQLQQADPGRRAAIIERLREAGPAGLDALIREYHSVPARPVAQDAAWRVVIDEVAGQRDAVYGGLFWQRDMQAALAQAKASGKPVLSLRLLGDLTSEYSCANSRLFRTLLYADPELATWLEANFVLHWSSERPVPRVEIDFGDGRVVERTITGNSAHFVLDASERTIDVIPGLWSAPSFRAALRASLGLHEQLAAVQGQRRWNETLADHHEARLATAAKQLTDELSRARGVPQDLVATTAYLASPASPRVEGEPVPALAAVPMAIGKSRIERPILAAAPAMIGGVNSRLAPSLPASVGPRDDLERLVIGARVAGRFELHPNTLAIIAAERPLEGLVPEDQRAEVQAQLLQALRVSIQQDTAKNALELHPRVHAELAARARGGRSLGFSDVDEWVYAELFETPAEDPWLGLVDPTVYTGLVDGGLVAPAPGKR
ncbi:hypothetical protein DB30_06889 [Enhygromyxa salina]|uniref:Uncharacterized protein n=1 Tax=Enhygromyxa salina TaxID=215803 RepID=A0A0C2D2C7_9BACT|nr:hypothetical protein [Enhygromyxa salina]KIG14287.1 hypothetical protein DB30_06889 [Enhygromyxa salina]